MTKRKPLQWFNDEDGRLGFPSCDKCIDFMHQPGLVEACASVGIEYGKSTGLMMRELIDGYHARGHKEPRP